MRIIRYKIIFVAFLAFISCSKEENSLLKNDFLMKTEAPAVAGEIVEFAYTMGTLEGILSSATAEVNYAGATVTGFDPNSYHSDSRGNDIGVYVADVTTEGNLSTATFIADTSVATLRFSYVVPEEAKGQFLSIKFSAESSLGEKVSITTPQYNVSKMTLKRDIIMTDKDVCYFSIETMEAYTESEVIANGLTDKIDLIYGYDAVTTDGYIYGHVLLSPGSEEKYLNGRIVPTSFAKNKTKIEKKAYLWDMQLSGEVPAVFVDDVDLEKLDVAEATDFILGITTKNSAFIESADGKYRAYLYFKEAKSRKLTFGIKRLEIM